ncbi:MAG: hypothetical protein MJ198_04890 [Bacteroidales bacterium]|nr:hypothetical protein [Bacteroidales bacterium]
MRNFSVIKERILQYLDYKKITKYKFYQETGITNGILSQSNGISEENILRFLNVYQDISLDFLFYGEGTIIKIDQPQGIDVTIDTNSGNEDVIDILKYTISLQKEKIERLERQLQKAKSRKVIENEHIA